MLDLFFPERDHIPQPGKLDIDDAQERETNQNRYNSKDPFH
jgi:hypothetical protein